MIEKKKTVLNIRLMTRISKLFATVVQIMIKNSPQVCRYSSSTPEFCHSRQSCAVRTTGLWGREWFVEI